MLQSILNWFQVQCFPLTPFLPNPHWGRLYIDLTFLKLNFCRSYVYDQFANTIYCNPQTLSLVRSLFVHLILELSFQVKSMKTSKNVSHTYSICMCLALLFYSQTCQKSAQMPLSSARRFMKDSDVLRCFVHKYARHFL